MRIYEELFIVRPDATDEQVDPLVDQLKAVIAKGGGTVDKADKWGIRKLAYRVKKFEDGAYILIQFSTADSASVKEVERRLRVSDLVLKYITVRIDEKLKRIEKRKKAREKRAARRPHIAAPAPALTAEQAMLAGSPMPGAPAAPAMPGAPVPAAPAAPAPAAPAAPAPTPAPAPAGESKE